jgi:MoxR-like ATPase
MAETTTLSFTSAYELFSSLEQQLGKVVIGQEQAVREIIIGLLAAGHILIEGVPGLGKTLLARALATAAGVKFNRIQFTPDLMPADITGHAMLDMGSSSFKIRRGPIFCNILLADEINRAPAKTQAALLEAMQEQQVTIEGTPLPLPAPFIVLATQNPIDQDGTYPLPQAQTDRFMCKVLISYPAQDDEQRIISATTQSTIGHDLPLQSISAMLTAEQISGAQKVLTSLTIDEQIYGYIVRIIRATREWGTIDFGAGPRGGINLLRAARAHAFMENRPFIIPDDVKTVAPSVLRHRITLSADMEIEGYSPDMIISDVLESVEAPRL